MKDNYQRKPKGGSNKQEYLQNYQTIYLRFPDQDGGHEWKVIKEQQKPQQNAPPKIPDNNQIPIAVKEAASYDSNALMIYLGAPQNARRRPLTDLKIPEFQKALAEYDIDIDNVIVHGPYVVNVANSSRKDIFDWSVGFLQKEVARMEEIGLKTIVLHPGSAVDTPTNDALSQVAKGINLVLKKSSTVRIALETMCGRGSEVGINFEQLKYIIDRVEQKERVVIHINDSLNGLGAKIDRHENIGYGNIETPRQREDFAEEIRILKEQN
ncbi:26251_t:CDS:2 [Gigaspora margarita]|uniref:26251_t:CDS:1 n=1 Tax=Gigaspora margarita TaxID=4874 RepID=A0ABM8VVE8_GIGMA|nr:26251_t:CDS:2 [Gigaspora margarita]